MRELLLGIAIAYFSLSPEGQKTAKKIIDDVKNRYTIKRKTEAKEGGADESKTAQS